MTNQKRPAHRILVVDDEVAIRQLNTEILSGSGYHVDTADDVASAWERIQFIKYQLVITDHAMPKATGVELLKKMHAARMDVPVIMSAAIVPYDDFARSPWLQPSAILLKPYVVTELLKTVKEVLRAKNGLSKSPRLSL
jgi:twitching motility two-component system response regulator PilH